MNCTAIYKEYKKQLLNFVDELIEQFPEEGDLVVMRVYIANQMEIIPFVNDTIYMLSKDEGKVRKMVKNRNENFFLNHNLMESLNQKNHLRKIWKSGILDSEDKEILWKWFDSFVYLSDQVIKTRKSIKKV